MAEIKSMMIAANYAGKAICISQTTAAHAMSYKITSLYKIPHGRAAFMCLPYVWEYMWNAVKEEKESKLKDLFIGIANAMDCENVDESIAKLGMYRKKF